jgi:hypothetical protein
VAHKHVVLRHVALSAEAKGITTPDCKRLACALRIKIYMRMKNRFRKAVKGRDLPAELAAFKDTLQFEVQRAQRLFNGDE